MEYRISYVGGFTRTEDIIMGGKEQNRFSDSEVKERLQKTLHGAFSGPPTPLKDIPTREGESRKKRGVSGASSANAKNVSPRKKSRAY
jgi:hypothetical protein